MNTQFHLTNLSSEKQTEVLALLEYKIELFSASCDSCDFTAVSDTPYYAQELRKTHLESEHLGE